MTAVLDVMISDHATAMVAVERIAKGRHRTINGAAMDRCKEIARTRRERVAVRARAANGREHWAFGWEAWQPPQRRTGLADSCPNGGGPARPQ
jgi:uncharacterized protein YcaQ